MLQNVGEEALVGHAIDHQQQALQTHGVEQFIELEDAALVGARELAQVHQHQIAFTHEPPKHRLPRIGMAEELEHPEAAVRIAPQRGLGEALIERRRTGDEPALQTSSQEIEEFMRFDGRVGEVGTSDHAHRAGIAPQQREGPEQGFAASPQ